MSDQLLQQAAGFNPLGFLRTPEETKARSVNQANVNFGNAIAAASMPVHRMVSPTGKVDKNVINDMTPFEDPSTMFNRLKSEMPGDVEIDQEQFMQRYGAGKQQHDMMLMNELNMMRSRGMDEKDIRKAFEGNTALKDYMYRNAMMEMPAKSGLGGIGSAAVGLGAYGAVRGAGSLSGLTKAPIMNDNIRQELAKRGYKYNSKTGLSELSQKQMEKKSFLKVKPNYAGEAPASFTRKEPVAPTKPKNLNTPKQKASWKKREATYKARLKSWRAARKAAIKKAAEAGTKDAARAALAGRGDTSRIAKAALKKGAMTGKKKLATNWVLGNMSKTIGGQVGKGLLAGGARFLGMTTPVGIAANAALLAAPWLWNKLTEEEE
tara:strand:+ start:2321 stop:3454 length:1134 start_codon:yes stop_codon:yes gene_type:complete